MQPDFRQRVTRVADVINSVPKTPAQILADVWLDWGTPDSDYTNCRLVKQSVSGQPEEFPDTSKRPPTLTRVYDELPATAEQIVGEPATTFDQYDNKVITIDSLQFSAGTAIFAVPGVTPAPYPNEDAILKEEVRTNDGTLQTIRRTYTTGGILADNEELRFGGTLVVRTIKSLNEIPATPAGFTLVTESTEYVRGLPLYSYGFVSPGGGGGGGIPGTGGEIGRTVQYNISPDQGTTGVTVTTIKYISDLSITTNPITGPVGSELIEVGYSDDSGYRVWTATYASGQGTITSNRQYKEGGKLVVYSITAINAAPSTPSATIGGTVTLTQQNTRNGTDAAAGTVIYDYEWVEGQGEISRAFTNSNGGAVDFNPATPTASIGPVVCTVRYLTATSVTSDPTTRPAGFTRVAIDFADSDGYRVWTVRYGYGAGTIVSEEEYRNMGRLTLFHRVALGAPPATPSATAAGEVVDVLMTDAGSGYTSAPAVGFTGGGGSGAVGTAVLNATSVASITRTAGGSGYTSAPVVSLNGGGGSGATATATLTGTTVGSITLTNPGSGYTSAPTVSFTGGGGTGAAATAAISSSVLSATITNAGSGYTSAPTVGFTGGGGTGAAGTAVLTGVPVASVALTGAGSGYTSAPTVTPSGGGGTGAAVTAVLTPVAVASVAVGNPGYFYSTPTIGFTGGGGTGAAATANLSGATQISGLVLVSGGTGYVPTAYYDANTGYFPVYAVGGGGSGFLAYALVDVPTGTILGILTMNGGYGFTSTPTMDLSAGGAGSGGSITAQRLGGCHCTGGGGLGFGYATTPTLSISGGGGSGAVGGCVLLSSSAVVAYQTNCGTGYSGNPFGSITGGGGSGADPGSYVGGIGTGLSSITLTSGGSGYTSAPSVSVTGGGSGGTATALLTATTVASLTLDAPGSGYTSAPTLSISGGGGSGATGTAAITATTIASITITNQGSGYTSAPTIGFTGGAGTGAAATANLAPAVISTLTLTAPGSGYTSAPTVGFTGGGGTGAAATAQITATSVASLALTAAGSNYTGAPTVAFSGGAGSGATGTTALTPTTVGSVTLVSGGSGYGSAPTVGFTGGAGSAAAATAEVAVSTGEVVLISAKTRHDDGYDVYDYTWAEGVGVIEERVQSREAGLRQETWTSFGFSAGTSVFTPPGVPVSRDMEFGDGVTRWTVTCMQSPTGGDPTAFALEYTDLDRFTYPGRAKAYTTNIPLHTSGTGFIYDVYKSPPIEVQIEVTATVTYQTSPDIDIAGLTYPLWNPDEWATLRAYWQGLDAYAKAEISSLFGYTAIGSPVSYTAPAYPSSVAILGLNALQLSQGSITVTGGPGDPGGTTVTISAKLEPAFIDVDGVQYYRKTVITAEIPAQPALPV